MLIIIIENSDRQIWVMKETFTRVAAYGSVIKQLLYTVQVNTVHSSLSSCSGYKLSGTRYKKGLSLP